LVGERHRQLDLLLGEGPNGLALQVDHADGRSFAQQRNAQHGSYSADLCSLLHLVFGIVQNIVNVNDFALDQSSPDKRAPPGSDCMTPGVHVGLQFLRLAIGSNLLITHSFFAVDRRHIGFAQLRCRLDERVEQGLKIERRAADDFKNVSSRGLLQQ
jgi:hypothetical protein